jgi:hypothetical protein
MHMAPRQRNDYSGGKTAGMIIGIALVVVGIVLMVSGAAIQSSAPNPSPGDPDFWEKSNESMAKFGRGAAMIVIGFGMIAVGGIIIYITNIRKVATYMATETAPAIEIAGGAMGKGIAEGTQEGGGIKFDTGGASRPREVVKVKCRKCGYLDTEDATFCSKCGARL